MRLEVGVRGVGGGGVGTGIQDPKFMEGIMMMFC